MENNVLLFSLGASNELANKISNLLDIPLGKAEVITFADGETMARPLEPVVGKKCFIIQSTSAPASQHIMEVLIFTDALANNGASEVVLVMPYYGYSRQDRVARPGEPITAKMVANLYQIAGANSVISIDLHTPQIQGFFRVPVIELQSIQLFGDYYNKKFAELGIDPSDVVIVAPDHGSAGRARDLSSVIDGSSIAFIDKRRPAPNKSKVINLVGDVDGKVCVIVDDIADTCMTINHAAEKLVEKGAKKVYVCFTHGVLSSDYFFDCIEEVVTTDTIEKDSPNVIKLSVANLLADTIKKML